MGKAKPAHHTAKELAGKARDATINRGGGKAGAVDRKGGSAGHAKFECWVCGQNAPDLKSMESHWESKHKKMGAFEGDKCTNKHDAGDGTKVSTTAGIAVQGSKYKKADKVKPPAEL